MINRSDGRADVREQRPVELLLRRRDAADARKHRIAFDAATIERERHRCVEERRGGRASVRAADHWTPGGRTSG
jgi:hypothetical protein